MSPIEKYRKYKGMTQQQLADEVNKKLTPGHAKLNRTSIYRWEKYQVDLKDTAVIEALGELMEMTPQQLKVAMLRGSPKLKQIGGQVVYDDNLQKFV